MVDKLLYNSLLNLGNFELLLPETYSERQNNFATSGLFINKTLKVQSATVLSPTGFLSFPTVQSLHMS